MPIASMAPEPVLAGSRPDIAAGILGFFACAPDADHHRLYADLERRLAFPLVGGTSIGNPFAALSGTAFTSNLAFLAKRNVRFGVGVSRPLTADGGGEQMAALYRDTVDKLALPPKLLVAILPVLPDMFMDAHLEALFSLAGDTPVFGGMVSGEPGMNTGEVLADGGRHRDRMVLVGFAGDVRPVFGSGCKMTVIGEHSPLVTEARGNVLLRVDDMPFSVYMRGLGIDPASLPVLPLFILIRAPGCPEGSMDQVNAVVKVDAASGAGILSSRIPVGARFSVGILTKENIRESTNLALDDLRRGMDRERKRGADFNMVLAISCATRYYTMSAGDFIEADLLDRRLPPDIARFGYYASREVCPVPDAAGKPTNRIIGQSIILCAL